MSGRDKIKVFQYDKEGKYLKTFESLAEIQKLYFKGKQPLFVYEEIMLLSDNTYICKERIGRDKLLQYLKRKENKLLVKERENKPIIVYNWDKIQIAEFYNIRIAAELLNIPSGSIHSIMKNTMNFIPSNKLGIYIKFKE